MKAAILREVLDGETRVALVPEAVRRLEKLGVEVTVEAGAGEKAYISDADYQAAGAQVQADAEKLLAEADIVLKEGMYLAVEVSAFDAPEFRVIGGFPEDNILVTKDGYENLTKDIPNHLWIG